MINRVPSMIDFWVEFLVMKFVVIAVYGSV